MEKNALSIFLILLRELHCLSSEERKPEKKTKFDWRQVVSIFNTGILLLCVAKMHISRVGQLSDMAFTAMSGMAEMYSCAHLSCTLNG